MVTIPEDIQPAWLSVIRRLQSVSKSEGLSVISINILVDANGVPQSWTEPKQVKIEPKRDASALLMLTIGEQ